jgi:hypothetical protein
MQEKVTGPCARVTCVPLIVCFDTLLTLDGGSETGSKEKFSILFAWHRDCWSVDEMLRSSSAACGLKGPSRASLPEPVSSHNVSTAFAGSISSLTSLKRTDWGWSGPGSAMVDGGE